MTLTHEILTQVAIGATVAGLAAGLIWLTALFRCRAREDGFGRQLRAELTGVIDEHSRELSARLAEVARKVESLEAQEPPVPAVRTVAGRNDRSRAIQLLRAGLAPASVASNLNLSAREMHLIAAVSRALTPHNNGRD